MGLYLKKLYGWSLSVLIVGCGGSETNIFQSLSKSMYEDEPETQVEQATIYLDEGKPEKAKNVLEPLIADSKTDSNDVRLLLAAAYLAEVKLDIWSIINNFLTKSTSKNQNGGLDQFLNSLTDGVLGSGTEKVLKLDTLQKAILTLQNAPDNSAKSILNTACLLSGILAVPSLTEAQNAIQNSLTALGRISGQGGCAQVSLLDSALVESARAAQFFSVVLSNIKSCSFLDVTGTTASLSSLELQLKTFKETADQGCGSVPTCPAQNPACQALFPECVQTVLGVGKSSAQAKDGQIASCELILHCSSGGCL